MSRNDRNADEVDEQSKNDDAAHVVWILYCRDRKPLECIRGGKSSHGYSRWRIFGEGHTPLTGLVHTAMPPSRGSFFTFPRPTMEVILRCPGRLTLRCIWYTGANAGLSHETERRRGILGDC